MATPVFAPDGSVRNIPDDQVSAALGAGGKRAVQMKDPQGVLRYVSEDMVSAAKQAGGTLAQPEAPWYKDISVGAVKSFLGGIFNAGLAGPSGGGYGSAINLAYPQAGLPATQQVTASPVNITPSNTTQKVGSGLEQAGEMMVTGGPLKEGAVAATRLLPNMPGVLTRLAPVVARIGAEGLNTGGIAALHGENPTIPAATGLIGGAVTEAAAPLVAPLKKLAAAQYARVLAPTTAKNKAIAQRVIPELLDRGEMALSSSQLQNKAAANTAQLGEDINQAVTNVPAAVKPVTANVISDLEKAKQEFIVNGVPVNENAVAHIEGLQQIVQKLGPDVSYQSLNRVRQIWDKAVDQAGGFTGKTLSEGSHVDAMREGGGAIRRELARQSPDISAINKEFRFWSGINQVLSDTEKRRTGQFGGLVNNMLTGGGAIAGIAHAGLSPTGGMEAAIGAAGMKALISATQSTAWRTASANLKNQIAEGIVSGNAQKVIQAATRITAGETAQISSSQGGQQ